VLLADVIGADAPAVEVTALAYDNRLVTPGTLFFCVPGFTRDGHDYADDAIARGAVALVVQRPLGTAVPRSSSTTCAPRWRPPPRRWPATRPRG
jgi:UDP-N-acetylmuramoyl-L-alanyl-D-glutamate--2,6-diaminopimelate ligase